MTRSTFVPSSFLRSVVPLGLLLGVGVAACDGSIGDEPDDGGEGGDGSGASSSVGAGGSGGAPPITPPSQIDCTHKGNGTDYVVGPGQAYESLGAVPFETLVGGDTVRITYRDEPYREKIMIGGQGTPEQPIRVCGIPGPNGERPVIDGANATTRPESDFPFDGHEVRGVVVIGHRHDDIYEEIPGPIVFEGLAVTGGLPSNSFTATGGDTQVYSEAAAGIFVQRGDNITIRGCDVSGNGNGLFIGTSGGNDATFNVTIEANFVHDNGVPGSDKQHNVYNEAIGVTYQFNRFGKPRSDSGAGNVKERSAGVVMRYNWIEGGSHALDLVDAQEAKATTVPMPEFHESYVYGNIFYLPQASGSMIHYGGDSGVIEDYRKGTLYFFHNTVVLDNSSYIDYDTQAIFELSTNEETLWSRNNVFYTMQTPTELTPVVILGPRDGQTHGQASLSDWVAAGITPYKLIPGSETVFDGAVDGLVPQEGGASPGFVDAAAQQFHPAAGSPLVGTAHSLARTLPDDYLPHFAYREHLDGIGREDMAAPTFGALLAE